MASKHEQSMTWTCDQCGRDVVDTPPDPNGATYYGAHQYGDPPSGWLQLSRWVGSLAYTFHFCKKQCLLEWLPDSHRHLGDK